MGAKRPGLGPPVRTRATAAATLAALVLPAWGGGLAAQETSGTLTLRAAVRAAVARSREVQAARRTVEEAGDRVAEAWSDAFPTVDLNASYTRNLTPTVNFLPAILFDREAEPGAFIPVQFGSDNNWNSTLSVEQKLFSADVFVGLGAAGRFKDLQEETVRGLTQSVVTRVRTAYYQLLLDEEQRRLTENSIERVRQSLAETRALHEAGLSSEFDVLRLEVELANLEPNLRRARNAVGQARRALALELDLPLTDSLAVEGSLASIELDDVGANTPENRALLTFVGFRGEGVEAAEEAIAAAAELRSDLRQARLTESLRHTEMRLEQVEYLPSVSVFGNYIVTAQDNGSPNFFGGGDGQRVFSRNVGVRVSIPIFQGLRRDARIDQKRALLRQAETRARLTGDQAGHQVRSLVEDADEALARARAQKRAVGQAQRGFEIASSQYHEGIGSQLEITDAEVALRESEFNYAQAVYDYLVARARLDEATGQVPIVDVDPTTGGGGR